MTTNLVPIQITLQAANAADVQQLVHDLAGTMSGQFASRVPAETVEQQPKRQQKATKSEQKEAKVDVEAIEKEINEEAGASEEVVDAPSVVELRAKAQEVGKDPAKKPKIKELLNKYGSPNVSEVPEEKRAAFIADLEAL